MTTVAHSDMYEGQEAVDAGREDDALETSQGGLLEEVGGKTRV